MSAAPLPGPTLASLPQGYRALVVGASGGIGAALVRALQADPRCAGVTGLHRRSDPPIDFDSDTSVADAASALGGPAPAGLAPFHLVINAAGWLHTGGRGPEKKLADLDPAQLRASFNANAVGPALLLRHLAPLLDRQRGLMVMLSAKVGSIGDNRLGGWYGYRASKAALNMLVKTAAIELRRSQPKAVLVALHPGTVATALSQPFRGDEIGRQPDRAAAELLAVIDALQPEDSGSFLAWDGQRLPW